MSYEMSDESDEVITWTVLASSQSKTIDLLTDRLGGKEAWRPTHFS